MYVFLHIVVGAKDWINPLLLFLISFLSMNKFIFMQAGLITAYILKALSFGRYVLFSKNSPKWYFQNDLKWEYRSSISEFHILELKRCNCVHVNKFVPAYACRHSSVREIALMMLMAYLSYMLSEVLESHTICLLLNWN